MREYKQGKLKSGGKRKVKSRKQAIAIGISEARKSGAKVPRKKAAISLGANPLGLRSIGTEDEPAKLVATQVRRFRMAKPRVRSFSG